MRVAQCIHSGSLLICCSQQYQKLRKEAPGEFGKAKSADSTKAAPSNAGGKKRKAGKQAEHVVADQDEGEDVGVVECSGKKVKVENQEDLV